MLGAAELCETWESKTDAKLQLRLGEFKALLAYVPQTDAVCRLIRDAYDAKQIDPGWDDDEELRGKILAASEFYGASVSRSQLPREYGRLMHDIIHLERARRSLKGRDGTDVDPATCAGALAWLEEIYDPA